MRPWLLIETLDPKDKWILKNLFTMKLITTKGVLLNIDFIKDAPPAYAPPAPYHATAKLPPQPFAYQYGVADDYSGANYEKAENQDASGNLQGSYWVNLPDGRVQIVTYTHTNGFVADVKYEGTAVYPEEKPYAPAPKYAPAPPKYAPA